MKARLACALWLMVTPLVAGEPASLPSRPADARPAQTKAETPPSHPVPVPAETIAWEPPDLGAPAHRAGGGTRGICQLCALAPQDAALTATSTPRFYWYLEPGFRNSLRFRLKKAGDSRPLLELLLPPAMDGGVRSLDLAEQGIALEAGQVYVWEVEMVPDPHQRWLRFSSGGEVVYRRPQHVLPKDPAKRLFHLARHGYWYDAVDALSRLIEVGGDRPGWLRQRAALLQQGGQPMLAKLDLERAEETAALQAAARR